MSPDIRDLLTGGKLLLAPMAGVNDAQYRGICKRMGATLTYTEMVSVNALHHTPRGRKSWELLDLSPEETPCAVQIFGADADIMATQAQAIAERLGDDVVLFDINMGCPVPKVVSRGEGSALMREPALAGEMVRRVAGSTGLPVTVKIRKGWSAAEPNAVEFARAMEAAGAAAIAVHGRTREQGYHGHADWDVIAAVKEAVSLPVIGSGDVFSAADARAMIERTGVDAVMIARGARGNPWIFAQARSLIDSGEVLEPPTAAERMAVAREHAAAVAASIGDQAYRRMRKHVCWYVAGLPGAAAIREQVNRIRSNEELDELLSRDFG